MTAFRNLCVVVLLGAGLACGEDAPAPQPGEGEKSAAPAAEEAKAPATAEAPEAAEEPVKWVRWDEKLLAQAQKEGKLIYIDIYADWCGPCQAMSETTLRDKGVAERLGKHFIAVKVDADREAEAARRFGDGPLPTSTILSERGKKITQQEGFLPADVLAEMLDDAVKLVAGAAKLEKEFAEQPRNLVKAQALADAYLRLEESGKALPLLQDVWKRANELDDGDAQSALFMLGIAQMMTGAPAEAAARFGEFEERYPKAEALSQVQRLLDEALYHTANNQLRDGEPESAVKTLDRIIERNTHAGLVDYAKRRREGALRIGKPAPALEVGEWVAGKGVTLDELKGKVVLLDFFQIVAPENADVHPQIVAWQKKFGEQGLQAVGLAVVLEMKHIQTLDDIKKFANREGAFNYPVAADKDGTATFGKLAAQGAPYAVLIDRKGIVRWADFFDAKAIEAQIAKLLAEK